MAENSKIEWTHHTFNPWRGCTKVSPGCANCYADTMSKRNPSTLGVWGRHGTRVIAAESYWKQPLKWDKAAAQAGERHRVFCASLADVFEGPETMPDSEWPKVDAARRRLFELIEATPNLDWLLLTKRPENVAQNAYTPIRWWTGFPPNVWLGTSVEDQRRADERIPELLKVPARVRFLSCEPLLGPVVLQGDAPYQSSSYMRKYLHGFSPVDDARIHWVIVGGESGAGARPMHPDWARSLRDECVRAGVAFFLKQWGEWLPFERGYPSGYQGADGSVITVDDVLKHSHEIRGNLGILKVGKHAAGRALDGRTWDELPAVAQRPS